VKLKVDLYTVIWR